MVALGRLLRDERSAIGMRHVRLASMLAAGSVVAGAFLILLAGQQYEQSGRRVLWALVDGGPLAL